MNPTEQPAGKLMESVKLHTYRIPIANIGQKHFFHFADSHLSLYDDLSTKEQREKALVCEREWFTGREYFEKKYEGALPKARQISAKEHFENLLRVSEKGDCLILTGDTLDYISKANVRYDGHDAYDTAHTDGLSFPAEVLHQGHNGRRGQGLNKIITRQITPAGPPVGVRLIINGLSKP